MFHELAGRDMEAAREALAEPIAPHPTTLRIFNLDIAKLLYVLNRSLLFGPDSLHNCPSGYNAQP